MLLGRDVHGHRKCVRIGRGQNEIEKNGNERSRTPCRTSMRHYLQPLDVSWSPEFDDTSSFVKNDNDYKKLNVKKKQERSKSSFLRKYIGFRSYFHYIVDRHRYKYDHQKEKK
jgi:hypothetical protein